MTRDAMKVLSDRYEREMARRGPDPTAADIEVPATPDVFAGISARNYAEADDAFWAHGQRIGRNPTQAQLDHLDDLRQRRKAAYADLRSWFLACEAMRLNTDVRRVQIVAVPIEDGRP
jgi:hypothetical protein